MQRRRASSRKALPVVFTSLLVLILGACGGPDPGPSAPAASGGGSGDPLDLRGVCPDPIVIQTNWEPAADSFASMYNLLGPNPQVDKEKKRVTAPLVSGGKDTGVKLELRAGGPAIGFTQATAQLYSDPSIHLASPAASDEVIQLSRTQPTTAVVALVDIDPQVILWDPEKHPQFHTIVDIGQSDTTVVYFGGDTYMEYLVGSGILRRSQVDGSNDGSPARFVAEQGEIARSGYATSDIYLFEQGLPEWRKPVEFQLVFDTGYPNYGSLLTIRTADKAKLAPCLEKLVPIVQRSTVEVNSNPEGMDPLIDRILGLSRDFKAVGVYSKEGSRYALRVEQQLGLTGNGTPNDGIAGNFDQARIQRLIDITKPIFEGQNKPIKDGLTPADVFTNEFIDTSIGVK